ncbi:MAG: sulfite exporter TauE/SafE family protein, partial [Nitrososphaerota archaeon]
MIPSGQIFLILLGFLVGIVSSMVGVGGGVFIVPALILIFESEFTSQVAVGTSLAVIVFTSLASTLAYSRQKRIDYKVGFVSAVTTVPGASLGAYLTSFVSSDLLGLIFAFFLIFIALRMLLDFHLSFLSGLKIGRRWHRVLIDSDGTLLEYDADILLAFALSFFGGLSSG